MPIPHATMMLTPIAKPTTVLSIAISCKRGVVAGSQNVRLWGDLPARGRFAVVNPEGYGRRLGRFSWGYPGQIEDLAHMPQVLAEAVPGLRIDRRRVYAMGTSMGGQETLLLLARHRKHMGRLAPE